MRFLHVCADPGIAPGATKGAAQHLRGVAAGLLSLQHPVITATSRRPEGSFPSPVVDLATGLADRFGGGAGPAGSFDVVYERYSLGHRGGLMLARRTGRPFVLEVNAPLVAEATAHRPATVPADAQAIEAELLAGADLVITVSAELGRWVGQHRVPSDGPTVVVANGFEPAWFPAPAEPDHDGPLVFIGHPKPWHGAERLPDLLARLLEAGHDPGLLLIGGGAGTDRVRQRAAAIGVNDRIKVTGPLPPERASALLADGSIGLAPYHRQEPFYFCPLKVVDYLAAGLPIVATDQGDIADLVGSAGVVVDPDDDTALVAAVAGLLADPGRRRRLGTAGRDRAMASLTWEAVAAATVAAIEDALRTSAPATATKPATRGG